MMHQLKISRSHLIFHLLTKKGKVVRNVPALYLFGKRVYMYQVSGVHASYAVSPYPNPTFIICDEAR